MQTQGLNLLELCQKGPLELDVCEFRKATVGDSKIRKLRQLRQIRQVENDPGGNTEDSLEGIQVVKQTGGKLPPLKISLQVDERNSNGNKYRGIYVYNFRGHLQENLTYVLGS